MESDSSGGKRMNSILKSIYIVKVTFTMADSVLLSRH